MPRTHRHRFMMTLSPHRICHSFNHIRKGANHSLINGYNVFAETGCVGLNVRSTRSYRHGTTTVIGCPTGHEGGFIQSKFTHDIYSLRLQVYDIGRPECRSSVVVSQVAPAEPVASLGTRSGHAPVRGDKRIGLLVERRINGVRVRRRPVRGGSGVRVWNSNEAAGDGGQFRFCQSTHGIYSFRCRV